MADEGSSQCEQTIIYTYTCRRLKWRTRKKKLKYDKHEGPFVRCLDEVLVSMNVQRQAYYGGTFIGKPCS